jgi:hypothetical protein
MQSPWLIQVGRLAWARNSYEAIVGWRRIWWRLWWRTESLARTTSASPSLPGLLARPKGIMHWGVNGLPWCGASCRERWTQELEFATCPICRDEGERAMTTYFIGNR